MGAGSGSGVEVITFGCRLNACESETLATLAAAQGATDAVIVNTCAVTGEAVRQARQAIRKARRSRPSARLIVTGCAAQIAPNNFAMMEEVDLVLGAAEKFAEGAFVAAGARVRVGDVFASRIAGGSAGAAAGRVRGYVEVQNGCDHRCTFCVIPFGRGAARSTPPSLVVERVRELVEAGLGEIVLTGVDLTSWGGDLAEGMPLGALVASILREIPELSRLRLSSLDAAEVDDELLDCLADPRLMPHLHLSLQSGDNLILKRMKRRHGREQALEVVERVRRVRPEMAFGADFIAGFPTESEAAFERSVTLVADAGLAFLHVFPFSPRPGTPAARMPPVPGAVVRERARRLRFAGEAALGRHLARRLGTPVRALVERPGLARAEDFTRVAFSGEAAPGAVIEGRINRCDTTGAWLDAWRLAA